MNKLFIGFISIIIGSILLLLLTKQLLSDCGIYQNDKNMPLKALAISSLPVKDKPVEFSIAASDWIERYKKENDSYIVYAESTGNNNYGFRSSTFSFHINKVLEGNKDITELTLLLHTTLFNSFYEYNLEERNRVSGFLRANSYTESDYPALFTNRSVYYPTIQLPQKNHKYILCIKKVTIQQDTEPYYFLISDWIDEHDASNDILLTPTEPFVSSYPNNITLFYTQDDLDSYCHFKHDLFQHYNIQ